MNSQFAKMNPVIVPANFPDYKKMAIIMQKLMLDQYPENIANDSSRTTMFFNSFRNVINRGITLRLSSKCNLILNVHEKMLKIEYSFPLYTNIDDKSGLFQHVSGDRKFEVQAKSFLKIVPDKDEEGKDINTFPTGDRFYSYIKFFEENIENRLTKLCVIQDFNNPVSLFNVSIPDFCKMACKGLLDDSKLPEEESIYTLINDLIYMDLSNIEKIQSGILRINKSMGEWGSYRIYFGGTIVCNEYSLKRFKYLFHPGLQLIAKYLESESKSESLRHKIEKEVFKKL